MKREQAERYKEHRAMENFYYSCIYEIIKRDNTNTKMRTQLNYFKAKLVKLKHQKLQAITLDTDQADKIEGETPSLYNVLQTKRRREKITVTALQEEGGDKQTTPAGIARTMTTYLKEKYNTIPVDTDSIQQLLSILQTSGNEEDWNYLMQPFEIIEIYEAIRTGRKRTAPGFDGIGREYYIHNWEIIKENMCDVINEMFFEHCMTPKQKRGIITCLPPKNKECITQGLQPHNHAE
jgi:hypothetical protein